MKDEQSRIFKMVVSLAVLGGFAISAMITLTVLYEIVKLLPNNTIE
jgi:hypothetical protein